MKRRKNSGQRSVRIAALGGGTGLSMVLRGLKRYVADGAEASEKQPIADLVAVVTVTDDGGSSGQLRREYKVLPPGDIRNCMVALSSDEDLLGKLFQYRFPIGRGLEGHSFGNLFVTALTDVMGDFPEAVRVSSSVLSTRGRIYPSTAQNVTLEATLADGARISGETNISRSKKRIERIRLAPRHARPLPEVLKALRKADLILAGPGSLYTSIIPNLLVEEVQETIANARGTRVYIANLMTQPGETDHYSVADHVRAIYENTRTGLFDCVVINRTRVTPKLLRRYRQQGADPVDPSLEELDRMKVRHISADLLHQDGLIRHDHVRLARLLLRHFVYGGTGH